MSGNSMLGFKDLPENSPRRRPLRIATALVGLLLVVFGVLGFLAGNAFTQQDGDSVLGMGTNGALSLLSVVVGVVVVVGVLIDGNLDAYINTVAGAIFMVAGIAGLLVMRTSYNYLAFDMTNVIFSFVVGLLLFAAGLYGRVSS